MEFDCSLMFGQDTDCPNIRECHGLNSQKDWRLRHNRIEAIQQETARKLSELQQRQAQWALKPQYTELDTKLTEWKPFQQKRDAEEKAQGEQIIQRLNKTDERLAEITGNLEKLQFKIDAYQQSTNKLVRLTYVVMGLAIISALWQFLSSAD